MAGRASFTYDVFLSFRGDDTRFGFTGNLYNALNQRGIHTFFDDKKIRIGEEITPALVKAIQESRIAIVVLSNNYAFSSFCLKELTAILECYEENKTGRVVIPVFYDVDPSDVRHCRGSFGEALAKHEKRFKDDIQKVNKWRMALHKAAIEKTAELAGFTFKLGDGYEYQLIDRIFKEVSLKINRTLLYVANYPVGLESRVDEVKSRLNHGSDDLVHMVGIWGAGGIGKSTIARAVYNSISDQFDGFCCFLEDVRENSCKYGLVHLQEMVLFQILGDKEITLGSLSNGKSIMEKRLRSQKVLLVLDDVDQKEQLQAIVGEPNWLCSGSRVIITTRDIGSLRHHEVKRTYEVEELSDNEARQLLTWNAFKADKVDTRYTTILDRAMCYASRLPLALEVIGSNLFGKGEEECKLTLDRYNQYTDKKINDILKVSYDSLEEDEKNVFLDIACCFGGYKLSDVENILHAHHGSPMILGIESLIEKSLIKIDDYLVTLHQLIRDMGRDIVRQESQEPAERSRLWFWEEVVQVLEQNNGTSKIHILILDFPKDEARLKGPNGEVVNWDGEAFKKMDKLKTLIIQNGSFSTGPTHLPDSLRVLKWQGYPSPSLPCYFHPMKLSLLELPEGCLVPCEPIQAFTNLRILNFSNSESITQIPDVSRVQNLETLSFRHCENLTKIHESVGRLGNLKILDASGCKNLKTFPPIILTSLEQFNLSHCSILESFPEILGNMEKITELHITGSFIKKYPFSIEKLTRLQKLRLKMCGMVQLPSSIFMLPELSLMHVSECQGLVLSEEENGKEMVSKSSNVDRLVLSDCNISTSFLPKGLTLFSNVKDLNLSKNNFTTLHSWIKDCHFLRKLTLDDCNQLLNIRGIPRKLEKLSVKGCKFLSCLDLTVLPDCTTECCCLKELILDDCRCLLEIKGLPKNLDTFSAKNCTSLTSNSINMLFNQEWVEAGNKMFVFPGKRIPEWFSHSTRGGSMSFWFRNKFPAISLCLVIELADEQSIKLKFRPRVFINGNKQSLGCQRFYEFMIETNHILLLKFEDVDIVLEKDNWNRVDVSYTDHINNKISIRRVARYSGIHVLASDSVDVQFYPPQNMINALQIEGPQQIAKTVTDKSYKDQNMKSLPILLLTQPPQTDTGKNLATQPILPIKRPLEDVKRETSESVQKDDVQNSPPVIETCREGDDVRFETVSVCEVQSNEGSYINTRGSDSDGSDSDDPFDQVYIKLLVSGRDTISPWAKSEESISNTKVSQSDYPMDHLVDRKLSVNGQETMSSGAISGDASMRSIREAINALELLMAKDLSEVTSDPTTQFGLHKLLDLLSIRTVEVHESIGELKKKALASFEEFQSTVDSVNKLKNFEKELDIIQQETVTGKDRRNDLKNLIKKVSKARKAENKRKNELEAEIAILKKQLATKETDLQQLVLNLKDKEDMLSTYSMNWHSLNKQARNLSEKTDELLAARSEVKDEGETAEGKQNMIKSTWPSDITEQLSKIKHNIFGLND